MWTQILHLKFHGEEFNNLNYVPVEGSNLF